MPATYTPSLRLTKPANGDTNWGTTVNSGFTELADSAIAGYTTVSMPSNADYTLTLANGSADQARSMMLNITSAVSLTATRNIICPSVSKLYVIKNATTGSQSIVIKTLAGSGITIPTGQTVVVYCNGTDVLDALTYFNSANVGYTPAGSGAVATTVQAKLRQTISVQDFGAVGNGIADDTVAINAALTYGTINGAIVYLPEGQYKITSTIIVDRCTLVGTGVYKRDDLARGSFFLITDTVNHAVSLRTGGEIIGCNFYYPNQVLTTSPIVYPATVKGYTTGQGLNYALIEGCTFVNSYVAIDLNGDQASSRNVLARIRGNNICAISIGINHPYTTLECHFLDNFMSYFHWYDARAAAILTLINSTAIAIKLGDVTGAKLLCNTVFGWGYGLKLDVGAQTQCKVSDNAFDGCRYCVHADASTGMNIVTFVGNNFGALDINNPSFTSCRALSIDWTTGVTSRTASVVFTGNQLGECNGDHIYAPVSVGTSYVRLNITGNSFQSAGANDTVGTHYNIYVNDTGSGVSVAVVSSNYFQDLANTLTNKVTAVYFNGKLCVINNNLFWAQNKAVDVSALDTFTEAVVEGNVARGIITKDFTYPATQGVTYAGLNRWTGSGTDVWQIASAATLTLPEADTKLISITGTVNITAITASVPGRQVTLRFTSNVTVSKNANLRLAANFTSSANDTLTLVCDGTNWYEVGRSPVANDVTAFTPVPTFATPGDLTVTYTSQVGQYTRVGQLVFISIRLAFTPLYTTASGDFQITGLPFTSASGGTPFTFAISDIGAGFTWPASTTSVAAQISGNSAVMVLRGSGNGVVSSTFTTSNLPSNLVKTLTISGCYMVA